MSKLGHKYNK